MNYDHDKYPIVIGAKYRRNSTNTIGILESAELLRHKNDALIEIKAEDDYCVFRMNYATFAIDWILHS